VIPRLPELRQHVRALEQRVKALETRAGRATKETKGERQQKCPAWMASMLFQADPSPPPATARSSLRRSPAAPRRTRIHPRRDRALQATSSGLRSGRRDARHHALVHRGSAGAARSSA
jgi:hypothetical protein